MIAATFADATASAKLTACLPPIPPAPTTPMLTVLLILSFRPVVDRGLNRRLPAGVFHCQHSVAGEVDG